MQTGAFAGPLDVEDFDRVLEATIEAMSEVS